MYKVLIIDDDKLARKGLIAMIPWEKCNMRVVGDVANGMQALEFLENNAVDLAIVDLSMPVLSGMEFIESCKNKYPDLQFVILTFHEEFENVQNAIRYGVLDYISKLRLEETDCEKIFLRISKLMDAKKKNGVQKRDLSQEFNFEKGLSNNNELSYEIFEEFRNDWLNLEWLYSDKKFDKQLLELKESMISERQFERILMWISNELEAKFDFLTRVPFLRDKIQGYKWLEQTRQMLYQEIENRDTSDHIEICILKAIIYIDNHIGQKLNSENVAEKVNMSRSYFSTNFKLITGKTFNDYVREKRVEQAKDILLSQDISLDELAYQVGYEDSRYFSKVFYAETGLNCSEFKKQFSGI